MLERLTIGEMAAEAGVRTSTVRYYERSGLLLPPERSRANYRLYGTEQVERLRFIRAAQASGLTLADIRTLLDYGDGIGAPCREVRLLIERRLDTVHARMREFRHVERVLKRYLGICKAAEQDEPCQVLEHLHGSAP